MSSSRDLHRVMRELVNVPVLSVYVDAPHADVAMRNVWRPALLEALRAERAEVTEGEDRAAFDRAASFIETLAPMFASDTNTPGWVAFITPEGPRYAAALTVDVPTLAVWRNGPFLSPYLRALGQPHLFPVRPLGSRSSSARQCIA